MKTEADIASHLGVPACIVYAQAFSTISSVIPAFSKRGDIIVADKAVGFAIRKGIQISRSHVRWYEHNDLEDMERVLQRVKKEQGGRELTRRFIVTEAVFENVGDVLDLPKVVCPSAPYTFQLAHPCFKTSDIASHTSFLCRLPSNPATGFASYSMRALRSVSLAALPVA